MFPSYPWMFQLCLRFSHEMGNSLNMFKVAEIHDESQEMNYFELGLGQYKIHILAFSTSYWSLIMSRYSCLSFYHIKSPSKFQRSTYEDSPSSCKIISCCRHSVTLPVLTTQHPLKLLQALTPTKCQVPAKNISQICKAAISVFFLSFITLQDEISNDIQGLKQ